MIQETPEIDRPGTTGRPGLAHGFVYLALIVILTHAAVLLMNQPAAYWQNPDHANGLPFADLLRGGPVLYLVFWSIYGFVVWRLLRRLHAPAAWILTAVILFIHLFGLFKASRCGFSPLFTVHSGIGCYAVGYAPILLAGLSLGLILLGSRRSGPFVTRIGRVLGAAAILWALAMGYGVVRAAVPPASPWQPLVPLHSPGPRTMSAIAYDTQRNRAVLFGGITSWDGQNWVYDATTWEWDGQDWQEMTTSVAPPGRILHAMAFDETRGKVILYGGKNESGNLADLWEWDGVTWHRRCPVCNPAGRFSHKMIFDSQRQNVLIYGGHDGKAGFAEAWSWDGESWTYVPFAESSPATYNAPLVYDSAGGRVISFMGREWGGTWIWKGDVWQKPDLAAQPPLRDEAVLVYDPARDLSILFGGTNEDKVLYDDTWIFQADTWTRLDAPRFPPQRNKAVAFYDPVRNSMIVYGGEVFGSIYSDMWELTLPQGEQ